MYITKCLILMNGFQAVGEECGISANYQELSGVIREKLPLWFCFGRENSLGKLSLI